ncbi:MAG: amidohydrolase family protein [Planctomycetota bacterium]
MKTVKLTGGSVVTAEKLCRADIILRDGMVALAGNDLGCDETIDITGKYAVPGFVDIHFHGYNLFEFTSGRFDPDSGKFDSSASAYQYGFEMLSSTLARFGVTGFYLASWAAPIETLRNCYHRLADWLVKNANNGAKILGGSLEGSFINPGMAGAQNPKNAFEHFHENFDRIDDRGSIKLANVVPDFGAASCRLTEYLVGKGIIVGAGHTNAAFSQVQDAVKAGLKYIIHFTNGPTGGSYKSFNGGGAIEAGLTIDGLYVEQIADGFHVNPAYVRDIIKRKGIDRTIAVTDALYVAGSTLREFEIGGVRGRVSDNGLYNCVADDPRTLCSSNLTMDRGFGNLLSWLSCNMKGIWNAEHQAMSFENALIAAAKMCSTNPCSLMGLDSDGYGCIQDGSKADLAVLAIEGKPGNYKVVVEYTFVDGNMVYSRQ